MSEYVVYHIKTTKLIRAFDSKSSAKRSVTCSNRNAGCIEYAFTDYENYNQNVVYKKKVRNLITGEEIEIDSNTPHCCDPSTETYWSI